MGGKQGSEARQTPLTEVINHLSLPHHLYAKKCCPNKCKCHYNGQMKYWVVVIYSASPHKVSRWFLDLAEVNCSSYNASKVFLKWISNDRLNGSSPAQHANNLSQFLFHRPKPTLQHQRSWVTAWQTRYLLKGRIALYSRALHWFP